MNRRTVVQVGISFVIGGVFLVLAFRNVPLRELGQALARFHWTWLLPAVAVSVLLMLMRTWRWQLELLPLQRLPFGRLWAVTAVAYSAINLLPARLGEVVRPWLLAQVTSVRMSQAIGSLVVEKLMDSFSILAYILLGLVITAELPPWIRQGAVVPAIFTAGFAAVVAITYARGEQFFARAVQPVLPHRLAEASLRIVRAVLDGMRVLPDGRLLGTVFLASLLLWFLPILSSWVVIQGFGFAVPFSAALVVFIFIGFGTALPNAPGMIGTFQYACVLALGLFGVPEADALAFGFLLNALQLLTIVAQGMVGSFVLGVSIQELRRAALSEAPAAVEAGSEAR